MNRKNKEDTANKIDVLREEIEKLKRKYNISNEEFEDMLERIKDKRDEIEEYIKKNPLKSIGLALLIGYLLGKLK